MSEKGHIDTPTPLWSTLQADIARFRDNDPSMRALLRGVLSQGFQAIFVYRVFRWFYERGIPTQPIRFVVERIIEMTTGISIPVEVKIGKGLRIHHFGNIMVHPETTIGEQCTLYQGITLGDLGGYGGAPHLGTHVLIGAGAKLLGRLDVGDHSIVGANAVVITSVPPDCVAVGVPAMIKKRSRKPGENSFPMVGAKAER